MSDDIVTRLRDAWITDARVEMMVTEAADEIERLRKERDDARRAYCEEAFCHRFNERRFDERGGIGPITDPKQIAAMMNWDCFREATDER